MSRFGDLVSLISTELNTVHGSTVPMTHGKLELEKNTSPPRVQWVVSAGEAGPAHGPGGNPRPIATRNLIARAYVWHDNYDNAEALLHNLILSCHNVGGNTGAGIRFDAEDWPTQDKHAEYSVRGQMVIARFRVALPVTAIALTERTVDEVGHTTGLEGSGQSGCSS